MRVVSRPITFGPPRPLHFYLILVELLLSPGFRNIDYGVNDKLISKLYAIFDSFNEETGMRSGPRRLTHLREER